MGEAKELQLSIRENDESNEASSNGHTTSINQPPIPKRKTITRWLRIGVYALFLLAGQSAATLLGRLYFDKGGNSKWLATLVQLVGFPILLPYYSKILISAKNQKNPTTTTTTTNRISTNSSTNTSNSSSKKPSNLVVASIYTILGLIIAADCYLYSVGLMYIPVSTYSLICASQLAFNAFFSFFINSQKLTPYIINSLVLLTVSSVLLVFNSESEDSPEKVSKGKYILGFVCTVGASAGYGLVLSLTQFFINKVLKREDFKVVMDVVVWPSLVASLATVVGLFASGEWAGLGREMSSYSLGKVSYVMNLTWTAITWQVYSIGIVGLIIEVSSLFANVIGVLGLPIVPVFAVFLFGEKMSGVKAVAMLLAVWGFISYVYQNYLDTQVTVAEHENKRETEESPQKERDQ